MKVEYKGHKILRGLDGVDIVPPTIPFGTISPGKASRSSYEAEQQERVLKQGS